jgi:hypothetical protein
MNTLKKAALSLIGIVAPMTASAANLSDSETIQVMVLGTFHFAGGADLINIEADDVRAPKRQAELERVAAAIAAFKPTAIAVERETAAPDFIDPKFADFAPQDLTKTRNEREQIGYRLAKQAGVTRVYGIDEQPSEGELDYFPFGKVASHAASSGQGEQFDAFMKSVEEEIGAESARLPSLSIADALIATNAGPYASPEFYYRLAQFDSGEDQPGAELQGYWFMRNAKIFSKLWDVAKPGDRIVVIYGAGHKFWLDHLVEQTPGFKLVDPVPYLRKAARKK